MAEEQKTEEDTAEDQPARASEEKPVHKHHGHHDPSGSRLARFKSWYTGRKKWTIPATVLLAVLLLAAVPPTRYALAGVAVKRDLSIKILDAGTNTPVSGATVSLGSVSAQTGSDGSATLHHVKAGHHKAVITKKYYRDETVDILAPILSRKSQQSIQLTATGRQVKITVTNLINKDLIENVNIKIAGTSAKTDKTGSAIVVLPIGATDQKATLSHDGFNDADVTVKVSNDKIQDNAFSLTPSGKVYFLSKLSGKIDVVKTNLDGTGRQTVLAGTGNEEDTNTILLASRDWKYLALQSRRAGNSASLYMIDTSNDGLTTIDEGAASFNPVGWLNDSFVYTVTRNNLNIWEPNRQAVKSFNAPSKKINILGQNQAAGNSYYNYLAETIDYVYAYNNLVYYVSNWQAPYGSLFAGAELHSRPSTFNSIKADGSSRKAIKSFSLADGTAASYSSLDERVQSPDRILFRYNDGNKDNYYVYSNGQVKDSNITSDQFFNTKAATYLQSPSGDKTFWSESRDGKQVLFIGDEDGQNEKQIAILSEYNTYGWYTDNYVLVSKNSSELYIMDKDAKQTPIKISDYHKPDRNFFGYGGGYGGI